MPRLFYSYFWDAMKNLEEILKNQKYRKIRFKITKTNHLLITAKINGVQGNFILDTGASTSCVGLDCIPFFNLTATHSETLAAGAGATGMLTQIAKNNSLKIGTWKTDDFDIVVFDLSHVNKALIDHHVSPVQGIIGADVLLKGKAIIDYYHHVLYLQGKN